MICSRKPKVGAAFAGGGVRGLAHIGVLQVLEEAGLQLDAVVGTSMGGLVAGLYAAGIPTADLLEFTLATGLLDLASFDPAARGLFNHNKAAALLADLLGSKEITFQDLPVRAAVIATDIERREMVILDRGPLIPAVAATTALPLLFAPVRHQGRWLVDGGVLNNLPVDVARQMGVHRVLGVSVPSRFTFSLSEQEPDRLLPRALFALARGNLDWQQPFLVAQASLGMTAQLINRTRVALCPPDVLLEVDLPDIGVLASDHSPQVVEAGRQAASGKAQELAALWSRPLSPPWRRRYLRLVGRLRRAWAVLRGGEEVLYPNPCQPGPDQARLRADLTRSGVCVQQRGNR
jgi:NTE family protein